MLRLLKLVESYKTAVKSERLNVRIDEGRTSR
jgi:hypothetical protein